MTGKTFLTKLIATIMVLIIATSFAAQTQVHAFEETATCKTKIRKLHKYNFELIIDGRKINDATITSTYGEMAASYGFQETCKRIISSFNWDGDQNWYNPFNGYCSYCNFPEYDYLDDQFMRFFPKLNPDKYTSQQKNDMVNIINFTYKYLEFLYEIQRMGITVYCNMF